MPGNMNGGYWPSDPSNLSGDGGYQSPSPAVAPATVAAPVADPASNLYSTPAFTPDQSLNQTVASGGGAAAPAIGMPSSTKNTTPAPAAAGAPSAPANIDWHSILARIIPGYSAPQAQGGGGAAPVNWPQILQSLMARDQS